MKPNVSHVPTTSKKLLHAPSQFKRNVLIVLGLFAIGGAAYFFRQRSNSEEPKTTPVKPTESNTALPSLKVLHPKLNERELVRSITQPAFIEALKKADLMSRVAGEVKMIKKNIGDSITKGEVLIEIAAPDLAKNVEQKSALIEQARQDLRSAESYVKVMEAAEKAATSAVSEKEADVEHYVAKLQFLEAELERFKVLATKEAILANIVDEKQLAKESAVAALKSSRAAVVTANNELERATAKLNDAKIEVDVKKARVDVTIADKEQTEAQFEYTKIRAPFNGTIIGRNVDPGTFVQNASTGKPIALLSVVQMDTVTAVMWVPEREAPFVHKDTTAIVKLDALDGQVISTKVDRMSNWLDPEHSRDMRIEVDIKNISRPNDGGLRIRPGMYGSMTLTLQRFDKAYLLPTSAVFQRNKKTCILQVEDGVAHIVPVRVEFEDGARIIVCKLPAGSPDGKEDCIRLTGEEVIASSGQGEIADGQKVKSVEISW